MKDYWWKLTGALLVLYSIIGGLLLDVPKLPILNETIRNLYYHVPMWFGMIFIMGLSVFHAVRQLGKNNLDNDVYSKEAANTGILLGLLGLATGSVWAKFTWGTWWVSDPKLNGAAITILIYLAYFVLRNSIDDREKKARIAAVYNIFAFVMLIVFLLVYPRMNKVDSLHPGNGGNPGFSVYEDELDNRMRIVFYPAILGWILVSCWIMSIRVRMEKIKNKLNYNEISI